MSQATERHRLVFTFRIFGDVKYVSHHDTLRLFRRALARSELPVRYSEGFNPHPKMSLPLPRPVGVASDVECLVLEMEREVDPGEAMARLALQLPPGIDLTSASVPPTEARWQPALVRYRLDVEDPPADLEDRVRRLREAPAMTLERADPSSGRKRLIDVRAYLERIELLESAIEFTLRVHGDGTAKPSEIGAALGFDPAAINHRIRRLEVQWR